MSYCCPTTRFLFHKRFLCLTTRHLLPPFHSPKLRLPSDGPGQTVPSAGGSWQRRILDSSVNGLRLPSGLFHFKQVNPFNESLCSAQGLINPRSRIANFTYVSMISFQIDSCRCIHSHQRSNHDWLICPSMKSILFQRSTFSRQFEVQR